MHSLFYLTPLLALLLLPKKKKMPEQNKYQIKKSLKEIEEIFGKEVTRNVEKIYRLETRNFSSGGFLKTNGAGMIAVKKDFPYGWTSLKKFWTEQPNHKPKKVLNIKTNVTQQIGSGDVRGFLVFPSLFAGMFALAFMLQKRGNDVGSWYSTNEAQKEHYRNLISKIPSTITSTFV